jgi:plasmid maintenance system antidote protein VapI
MEPFIPQELPLEEVAWEPLIPLIGKAGISADMSLRLSAALGTHAEIWHELQTDYDLWQASQKKQPKIEPFNRAA